jgi:hypothetical protein
MSEDENKHNPKKRKINTIQYNCVGNKHNAKKERK